MRDLIKKSMLNIISLSALREKVTWPGKVVKNLMKWLDMIGYPFILNGSITLYPFLLIHDDMRKVYQLDILDNNIKVLLWPNLDFYPSHMDNKLNGILYDKTFLVPSHWIKGMLQHFGYVGDLQVWPAGIDTHEFFKTNGDRHYILVYFKSRSQDELNKLLALLKRKHISYKVIIYGNYTEEEFKNLLYNTKYVVWIWRQESQWIALQEILAMDIPIVVWDVKRVGDWVPKGKEGAIFSQEELDFNTGVTSAEYFNDQCWIKVHEYSELIPAIDHMESKYQSFTPRQYIEKNLSLEKQAKAILSLFWIPDANISTIRLKPSFKDQIASKCKNAFFKIVFHVFDTTFFTKIRNYFLI